MQGSLFRRPTQHFPRFGNNVRVYAPESIIQTRERELNELLESQIPKTPEHQPIVTTIPDAPRKNNHIDFLERIPTLRRIPFECYDTNVPEIKIDIVDESIFENQLSVASVEDIFSIPIFNPKKEESVKHENEKKKSVFLHKPVEIMMLQQEPHPFASTTKKPKEDPKVSLEKSDIISDFLNEEVDTEINETDEVFEVKEIKSVLRCVLCAMGMCFIEWNPTEKATKAMIQRYRRMGYRFTTTSQKNRSRITFTIYWRPTWESIVTVSKTIADSIKDKIMSNSPCTVSQKAHLKILEETCKCSRFIKNPSNWKLY
jgi:hypothetical protein